MATKRLIDANALRESVITDYYEHFTGCHDSDQVALIDMVCDDIDESPTVDAVEVVHGRWFFLNDYQSKCTKCFEIMWVDHDNEPNYCPNCGAKMDRERRNNGED